MHFQLCYNSNVFGYICVVVHLTPILSIISYISCVL